MKNRDQWLANGALELFLGVIEHLPLGVHLYRLEAGDRLVFAGANPAADRILRVDNQQFVGKTIEEAFPPLAATEVPGRYRRVAATGEPWETEQVAYEDGTIAGAFMVQAFQTGPGRMAATFLDITGRKRIEEELLLNEARFASLYRISQFRVVDEQQFLDYALHEAIELTGSRFGYLYLYDEARREFTLNSYSREVMPSCGIDEKKACYELEKTGIWGEAVRQRRPIMLNDFAAEHPLKRGYPAGHVPLTRFLTVPVFKDETIVAVVGVANKGLAYSEQDVLQLSLLMDGVWKSLERTSADRALREREAMLNESQRVARIGYYALDVGAGTWTSSPVLDEIFGVDAAFPHDVAGWLRLVHPEERETLEEYLARDVLREHRPFDREYRVVRVADGAERWVRGLGQLAFDAEGRPVRMFGTIQDITDRKRAEAERLRLEQQMLHAQKLESLGVLAGGIAHDFNNILMTVIGNAGLGLMRLPPESPATENLRQIEIAASRAADLAKQMLAYSGKGRFVVEPIDVNRLVEEMAHMLQVSISKSAILRFNLTHPLPTVDADATQVRQVIMNLVINAAEAIGEKSGIIAVGTGCMRCERGYLRDLWLDEQLPEGLYVVLEIADTGCGMDKETLSRLFDPFFSTKFAGRGLGMAAVLGIVRGHRGAIKVYSEPGKGTTFKILLAASSLQPELLPACQEEAPWRGSGAVLLVDDEESVRAVGGEMLRALGFTVTTASDGLEALQRFREGPRPDLVILDLTMPHLDGEQTFRQLRTIDPGVRVVISSGYNEMEVSQKFTGKGLAGFIQKPYSLTALQTVLARAFGGP
jgi:PAS domain S-box-containing protein